ncbi:MAG TPA: cytochrome c biogenesis protein CcdA, partial [Actinomycetota bacterium]|nr:cytochrome c biogenesis protein CcdA [Actinomycetota bacterium]
MSGVPFALAFGAGLVASVNPCGFALLPSLLAFQLGTEARGGTRAARVADGLVAGLVLTAGFMLVFGAAGAVFALGGGAIVAAVPWITVAVGVGLVGLGAWLLSGRYLAVPLPGLRAPGTRGNRSLFLFGAAYAVGSLSCTLPVFLLVVGSALATGSLLGTIGVFLAYALGMSTVLMVLCLGTAGVRELVFRRVRRLSPHLQRITGTLLLLGGGYVVAYWLSLLRGGGQGPALALVQDVQRFAQDLVLRIGQGWWMALGVLLLAGAVSALAAR